MISVTSPCHCWSTPRWPIRHWRVMTSPSPTPSHSFPSGSLPAGPIASASDSPDEEPADEPLVGIPIANGSLVSDAATVDELLVGASRASGSLVPDAAPVDELLAGTFKVSGSLVPGVDPLDGLIVQETTAVDPASSARGSDGSLTGLVDRERVALDAQLRRDLSAAKASSPEDAECPLKNSVGPSVVDEPPRPDLGNSEIWSFTMVGSGHNVTAVAPSISSFAIAVGKALSASMPVDRDGRDA